MTSLLKQRLFITKSELTNNKKEISKIHFSIFTEISSMPPSLTTELDSKSKSKQFKRNFMKSDSTRSIC